MLNFTDAQKRSITKDILLIPDQINNPESGLIAQKNNLIIEKDKVLEQDESNKVFSDAFITSIESYHAELVELNSSSRTNYSNTDLENGGKKQTPHYTQTWPNFKPIVIPSNNGNPITALGQDTEAQKITKIINNIALLKTGFTDGANTEICTNITDNDFETTLSSFSNGQRIVIDQANVSLIGVITGVSGAGPYVFTYTKTSGANGSTIGTGARIRNFHNGFNDSERSHQSTPYAPEVRDYFESLISTEVNFWKTKLDDQKIYLLANTDTNVTRKTTNTNAVTYINNLVPIIVNWTNLTLIAINGKFSDFGLLTIENEFANRNAKITSRISEISTNLGSVSQSGDGSFTGSGAYYDLFKWIDIRISLGIGTLYRYNNSDLGIVFFDNKIAQLTATLAEYEANFTSVHALDYDAGEPDIEVSDIADLNISDTILVLDENSITYTRIINGISGNIITLNSGIPANILNADLGRVAKQK